MGRRYSTTRRDPFIIKNGAGNFIQKVKKVAAPGSPLFSFRLARSLNFPPLVKSLMPPIKKPFLGSLTEIKFLRKKLDKLTAEKRKKTWKRIRKDKII